MPTLEEIYSKFSYKELAKHAVNYTYLYTKPLWVWKKVLSVRKTDSLNLVALHLCYYGVIVLLMLSFRQKSSGLFIIGYVVLETVATLIPFLIFIFPFLCFTKVLKLKVHWSRLFRLLLIIKVQFSPIFLTLILVANYFDIESPYILIDNLIFILLFVFILLPPILIGRKWLPKLTWAITNYVFALLYIFLLSIIVTEFKDVDKAFSKFSDRAPTSEYVEFQYKYENSIELLDDEYYFELWKIDSAKNIYFLQRQFVSTKLHLQFIIKHQNELSASLIILTKDSTNIKYKKEKGELTLKSLESLRIDFNKKIQNDIELSKLMSDSSKFESNKRYFKAINNYLNEYTSVCYNNDLARKVIKWKDYEIVHFGNHIRGVLHHIDTAKYTLIKKTISIEQEQLERRKLQSLFMQTIFTYPLDLLALIFEEEMSEYY